MDRENITGDKNVIEVDGNVGGRQRACKENRIEWGRRIKYDYRGGDGGEESVYGLETAEKHDYKSGDKGKGSVYA